MDNILCLIHNTNIVNLESLLLGGEIYNTTKLRLKRRDAVGYTVQENSKIKYPLLTDPDQFPGVYMSLIDSKSNRDVKYADSKDVSLVFCPDILLRGDFHYNKIDSNGFLNEGNTLFNLEELLYYLEYNPNHKLNEVVFHNPVSLQYLRGIWVDTAEKKSVVNDILKKLQINIPVQIVRKYKNVRVPYCNLIKTYNSNYCYYLDSIIKPDINKPSEFPWSKAFYNRMLNYCEISEPNPPNPKDMYALLKQSIFKRDVSLFSRVFNRDLKYFREYLHQKGVTKKFINSLDDFTLTYLREHMTVVDLKNIILYSKYDTE